MLVKQTSKWGQSIAISLISLGGLIIATAYLYKIDEIITVPGILAPSEGSVAIKSPISGNLEKIEVAEGDYVKKGEVLAIFDVKKEQIEKNKLETNIILEKRNLDERLLSNRLKIENKKNGLRLSEDLLIRLRPLNNVGALSEIKMLQQEEKITNIRNQILQLEAERDNIKTRSEAAIKKDESRLKQIELILEKSEIRSPINGEIFNVEPDVDTYVTSKGEILMEVVPKDRLSANLKVSNRDIGFMQRGQKVKVRVDSYPFTEYGELVGDIKTIGADALDPDKTTNTYHFPVSIELKKDILETKDGLKIPLQAGMTVSTNIKLRERRLIEIVSDMLVKQEESIERLRKP